MTIIKTPYNHRYESMAIYIRDKAIRDNMLKMCQDESKTDSEVVQTILKIASFFDDVNPSDDEPNTEEET